jgi:hypothetical protein
VVVTGQLFSLLALGSAELGVVLAALGVLAVRVGRAAGAEGGLHLALYAFSAGLAGLLGVELMLLWVGGFSSLGLVLCCVALAAGVRAVAGQAQRKPTSGSHDRSWLLWVPAAVAVGLALARMGRRLLLPPVAGDALAYHLPMAAQWVQHGTLLVDDVRVWFYPGNAELVLAALMLPFRADFFVTLPDVAYWALAGLAVAGILEQLGQTPRTARLSGLVLVSSPLFVRTLGRCGSDLLLATAFLLVVYLVLRAARAEDSRGPLFLGASLLGVLCGTKYSAATEAVLLGLFALAVIRWPTWRAFGWRGVALAALPLLWLGGSYYLRNAVLTGNPVFPLGFDLGFWSVPPGDHGQIIASAAGIDPEALAKTSILRSERPLAALHFAALHSWRLAGPLLLLPLLSLIGVLAGGPASSGPEVRARLALFALLPGVTLVFLVTPFSAESVPGTLNQIASGASLRYALPVFALLVVASVASMRLTPRILDPLLGLLVVGQAVLSVRAVPLETLDVTVASSAALLLAAFALRLRRTRSRRLFAATVLVACLVPLFWMASLQEQRRVAVYTQVTASGVVEWLDRMPPGRTLMASIGVRAYPFFGRRLEHRVLALGLTRSWQEWSERIAEVGPDLVLVSREQDDPHSPTLGAFPRQEQGLRADPARFRRVYADANVRVYAVHSSPAEP